MVRPKKRRILGVRPGKELEACRRHYNWIHQGSLEKNPSVFRPLSDDYETASDHNTRRMLEESSS